MCWVFVNKVFHLVWYVWWSWALILKVTGKEVIGKIGLSTKYILTEKRGNSKMLKRDVHVILKETPYFEAVFYYWKCCVSGAVWWKCILVIGWCYYYTWKHLTVMNLSFKNIVETEVYVIICGVFRILYWFRSSSLYLGRSLSKNAVLVL